MSDSDESATTSGAAGEGRKFSRRLRYRGPNPRRFEERYKELDPEKYPDMQTHVRGQGRTPAGTHVPILLSETLEMLAPQAGDVIVDCTLGYGGHARAFLEKVGPSGRVIGIDVDVGELEATQRRLARYDGLTCVCASFAGIERVLADLEPGGANVIFADLGVSSMQIDNPARGFSYKQDGPLDMRMGPRAKRTAADWLNGISAQELTDQLVEFSDEPNAKEIAEAIAVRRAARPFLRTQDLADTVRSVAPDNAGAVPRVFRALRMMVNDELGALRNLLRVIPLCLRPGGRIGIISFHSGEDRLVKSAIRNWEESGLFVRSSDTPITPGQRERHENPRSNAARLRSARKI